MATDDQQVLVTGTAAAPASFRIPGNGQIQPKSVFATYDGTGAAGAFQPALKVISDGGEVVGIYPCDTSVQAGGTADVSWFPHVAAQKTAALPLGLVRNQGTQVISALTQSPLTWSQSAISDSAFYSWTIGAPSILKVLQAGTYLAWLSVTADSDWPQVGSGYTEWHVSVSGAGNIATTIAQPFGRHPDIDVFTPTFSPSGGVSTVSIVRASNTPCNVQGLFANETSANFTVGVLASLTMYRLGDFVDYA